jgi:hypothetical protein
MVLWRTKIEFSAAPISVAQLDRMRHRTP